MSAPGDRLTPARNRGRLHVRDMHIMIRTSAGYDFTGERIGRDLGTALEFLASLGARPDDLVLIAGADGRALLRGRLADLADLA